MHFRKILFLILIFSPEIFANNLTKNEPNDSFQFSYLEINDFIKTEARQIQDALTSIELSNELKTNHFTLPQLSVLTEIAKRFINCAQQTRQLKNCAELRDQMNMVNEKGEIVANREMTDLPILTGPGDILSSIGDSYQVFNDTKELTNEYKELVSLIPKEGQRGFPSLSTFSRLSAIQMRNVLHSRVYPTLSKINENIQYQDELPTSEEMWNSQTKCNEAIGYKHINSDATDKSKRCQYSELDPNGIIKSKEYPLKYFTPCIKGQGHRGTCTAFATVGALEIRLLKNRQQEYNLSEQFTYFYNEIFGGWWGRYQYGVNTMSALKRVKNHQLPIPLEEHWVYNPSKKIGEFDSATKKHPDSCIDYQGQKCTDFAFQADENITGIHYAYTIPTRPKPHVMINSRNSFWNIFNPIGSLDSAITYLNNGDPIIVSFTVKSNFKSRGAGDNYVRYADVEGNGGHAAVLVGFVKNEDLPAEAEKATEKGYFILRNSWGGTWADCGHIYVDYKYLRKFTYGLARITYNLDE